MFIDDTTDALLMEELMDNFQELIDQAHKDTNVSRAEKGLPPLSFAGDKTRTCPGINGKPCGASIGPRRSLCNKCYQLNAYHDRKLHGKSSVKTPTAKVSTDDYRGVIRVLDTQIALIEKKLEQLRAARKLLIEIS